MSQEREKLVLTKEEARLIVYEDSNDYDIIEDTIDDTSRWSENHSVVIQRVSDGKYFSGHYSQGLTESQDERAFDNYEPDFREVFQAEKTIIVYE